jgi:hypothetical protein
MRYWMLGALYLAASGVSASDLTINLDLPIQSESIVYAPNELADKEPAAVPSDVTALPDYDGIAAANVEDYFAEEFAGSRSNQAFFALDATVNAYFEVFDRTSGYCLVTRENNGNLKQRFASNNFNPSGSLPADTAHNISRIFSLDGQLYAFSQSAQSLKLKTGSVDDRNLAWTDSVFNLPAHTVNIYQRNDALYAFVDEGVDTGIWRLQNGAAQKVSSLAGAKFKWAQESVGTVLYGLKLGELFRDDLTDNAAAQSIATQVDDYWPAASGVLVQRVTNEGGSLHWYDVATEELTLLPSELQSGAIRLLPSCSANFGVVSCLAKGNDAKWYTATVSAEGVVLDSRFQSTALNNVDTARVFDITAIGSNRFIASGTTSSLTLQKVLPNEELLAEFNPNTIEGGLGTVNSVFSYRMNDGKRFYTLIRTANYILQVSFDVQGDLALRPVPATIPAAKDNLVFPADDKKASSISPIGLCLALLLLFWRSRKVFKEK